MTTVQYRNLDGSLDRRISGNRGNRAGARAERMKRHMWNPTEGMTQDEIDEFVYDACQDPKDFATKILGAKLFARQEEMLEALQRYNRLAIAGCNASGKTFIVVPYSLWRLTMADSIEIIQIAPTEAQSKGVYWTDMRRMYNGSVIAGQLLENAQMFNLNFEIDDNRYAHAMTPKNMLAARGYHNAELLFLMDEANGIEGDVHDAIKGVTASGDTTIVMLGNPTNNSGPFYDAFHNNDLGWHTINISAFDSPNLITLQVPEWFEEESEAPGEISDENRKKLAYLSYLYRRYLDKRDRMPLEDIPEHSVLIDDVTPYQCKRMFVAEQHIEWAPKGSASWFGQVLGVFPDEGDNQMFARRFINAANVEETYDPQAGPMLWGVDPAGMGQNEFVVTGVQLDMRTYQHRRIVLAPLIGENAVEQAMAVMLPFMPVSAWINVDRSGAGERPHIEIKRWAAQWGVPVIGFNAGDKSTNPLLYRDLKAQMYCFTRDLLMTGNLTGVTDAKERQQLLSVKYDFTGRGQTLIESKKDMAKRGVESPDRAEGLIYACFNLAQFIPFGYYSQA